MKTCTYCGETFDITRDHVIPNSFLRTYRKYEGDWTVPACRECNSLLGAELLFNVPDRAAFLAVKFAKRYRKDLNCAVTKDDIDEAQGYFREYLKNAVTMAKVAKERLAHIRSVATMPRWWMAEEPALRDLLKDDDEYQSFRLAIIKPFRELRKGSRP